jgi:hypothetical protein
MIPSSTELLVLKMRMEDAKKVWVDSWDISNYSNTVEASNYLIAKEKYLYAKRQSKILECIILTLLPTLLISILLYNL